MSRGTREGKGAPAPAKAEPADEPAARSRRAFFLSIPSELAAAFRDVRGVKQHTYAELPRAPDSVVAGVRPVAVGGSYSHREGRYLSRRTPTGELADVCDMGEREYAIFARFSGSETLAQISVWAAETYGVPPHDAFRLTRGVFLRLLALKACRPAS